MESQIPEHIKVASKELTFPTDPKQWERVTKDFCDFCKDKGLHPWNDINVDLSYFYCVNGYSTEYHYNLPNKIRPFYKDGVITGFTSILEIYREKPLTMKAGKFLRKIFPFLTDKQIDQWVCHLKAEFMPVEFELVAGKDEESFRYAYQEPHTPKRSPSFTRFGFNCYVKRLDSSCMRGEYFPKPQDHPAIVYAAGDLEIVYAKQKGKDTVGARVITYPARQSFSDIYTCDDSATELLVNYLKEKGFTHRGIDGAKVRKIDHPEGYLMPYVDDCETCEDIGKYFVLGSGSIPCHSTEGFTRGEPENYCEDCQEYTHEDVTQVEAGHCVCESCRYNSYTYSRLMDSYIPNDDVYSNANGDIATSDWFDRNGYVLDVDCEYQLESECVYYEGEYYHESHCDVILFNGEYYHEDSDELQEAIEAKEKADMAYQVKTTTTLQWTRMEERNPTPYLAFKST
jgi:hypothetical protein